jgi:hypothetical protein
MDVLSRLKILKAFTAPTLPAVFPSSVIDSQGIYFHERVQDLNLNRRSISGLEPEMPVTIQSRKLQILSDSSFKSSCISLYRQKVIIDMTC